MAKSDPDGYTLFFTTVGAVAINPALRTDLPYDPLKDFAAVGKAAVNSTILVVNADMPVNSARDLVELAQSASPTASPSASPAAARFPISAGNCSRTPPA